MKRRHYYFILLTALVLLTIYSILEVMAIVLSFRNVVYFYVFIILGVQLAWR